MQFWGETTWGKGGGGRQVTEGEAMAKTRGMARDVAVKAEASTVPRRR